MATAMPTIFISAPARIWSSAGLRPAMIRGAYS